jgi:hypothetical protein
MTRFAVSFIGSLLAFIAGLITAASWKPNRPTVVHSPPIVVERCPPGQAHSPVLSQPSYTVTPEISEIVFAQGRLKLVPERLRLKSESLRYDIDVTYPQIAGPEDAEIRKVNQIIRQRVTEGLEWPLRPAEAVLRLARDEQPLAFNKINLIYETGLATDTYLAIRIMGYSDTINAPGAITHNLVMNFDLASGKQLKLSDIFKPGSKYLEIISLYCIDDLERTTGRAPSRTALAPLAENFANWQITSNGISFNMDGCKVYACKESDTTVEIPFSEVKRFLNPGIPGKFNITYP